MAGKSSRRTVDSTDKAVKGQNEETRLDSETREELADRDQSLADADQAGSDHDQTAADREQAAADSDQAASDRDLAHGGDPEVHRRSREARDRSAQQRRYSAQGRIDTANSREQVARARDLTASARDRAAEQRDREPAEKHAIPADERPEKRTGDLRRPADDRQTAAADRAAAAQARARTAADRAQAALDREQAARDRAQAQGDREELLNQLAIAQTDGLTGSRARATGLEHVDQEIQRARRTMAPLVVAYVDVVGLKAVNDAHGHAAGDALLKRAVHAIRGHLRSYDLIVRIGGDEFLCVMSGATIEDAHQRFNVIQSTLASDPDGCEIKVGFAALAPEESAAELIRRADSDLPPSPPR